MVHDVVIDECMRLFYPMVRFVFFDVALDLTGFKNLSGLEVSILMVIARLKASVHKNR